MIENKKQGYKKVLNIIKTRQKERKMEEIEPSGD